MILRTSCDILAVVLSYFTERSNHGSTVLYVTDCSITAWSEQQHDDRNVERAGGSAQEILHASTHVFCQVHRYVRLTGPPKKSSTLPPMSSAKYTSMYAQQVRPRNPPRFHPCLLPSTQVCTPNRSAQAILHASTHVFCQAHRYVHSTGPPKISSTFPPISCAKYMGMIHAQQVCPGNPSWLSPVSSAKYIGTSINPGPQVYEWQGLVFLWVSFLRKGYWISVGIKTCHYRVPLYSLC